jgi:hypothetical protein
MAGGCLGKVGKEKEATDVWHLEDSLAYSRAMAGDKSLELRFSRRWMQ